MALCIASSSVALQFATGFRGQRGRIFPASSATTATPVARALRLKSGKRYRSNRGIVRCEQASDGKSGASGTVGRWLGRFAMLGFVAAIAVEIATGKGLLQNLGLTGPAPVIAYALTAVVALITAFTIFKSATSDPN